MILKITMTVYSEKNLWKMPSWPPHEILPFNSLLLWFASNVTGNYLPRNLLISEKKTKIIACLYVKKVTMNFLGEHELCHSHLNFRAWSIVGTHWIFMWWFLKLLNKSPYYIIILGLDQPILSLYWDFVIIIKALCYHQNVNSKLK